MKTNQIEIKELKNIAELVDEQWFCQYPQLLHCIHNNGNQSIGEEFQEILDTYGIISKPTAVKNYREMQH